MTGPTVQVKSGVLTGAALLLAGGLILGGPAVGWMQTGGFDGPDASAAYGLAAAAVNRGVWEVEQGNASPRLLLAGRAVEKLDDDYLYTDVPGGVYRVRVRYVPESREYVVRGTGIEIPSGRSRTIEAVYSRQPGDESLRQTSWRSLAK